MLLEQGWLAGARRVPSPHYDCRPDDETPTLLVVHNISLPPRRFWRSVDRRIIHWNY